MRRTLTVVIALICAFLPAAPALAADGLRSTEVTFRGSGGLEMRGTVLTPAGATGPLPGMVLVHGSGAGTPRAKLRTEAEAFARQGMAVLIYDKRAEGYSMTRRDYGQLADDALGAHATLRSSPGVDPDKVGIWGLSEGGWVAPLAASRSKQVAFVVIVGGNAMEPLRQQTWAVAAGLRKAGVSGPVPDRGVPAFYRFLAGAGMFPMPWHDAQAVLAKVGQPMLGIWGAHDLLTPPQETPGLLARGLGHDRYTLRYFPGADHAAHLTSDGGVTRDPRLAPGYPEAVGTWVKRVTSGDLPDAETVGDLPRQASLTVPVPPAAFWESAAVQVLALAVFLVAFAGYPVWALVRRVRGRGVQGTWPARVLALGAPLSAFGALAYLMYSVIGGGKLASPGPVVAGRPVIWLLLQALAVAALVAAAFLVPVARRARGSERVRLGALLTGAVVFLLWALYWGVLSP
ncbi:alpha/beta hydrolase family protein [Nonomuraea typhae]|uniref:Alpha/beta hydrolase family protein n=1 Tax=Nonomuraea typhae TaxID=2603600 RepID=A0ABW7YKA4_9ACTN